VEIDRELQWQTPLREEQDQGKRTECTENDFPRSSDSGYLSIRKLRSRIYDVLVARERGA